ncbi:hypothetical protein [Nocardia inohanensis]|uniref:hypothetical protein n=1 Tax=Nocardia inohanensis TaxID=209246 RepID=UPI000AB4D922
MKMTSPVDLEELNTYVGYAPEYRCADFGYVARPDSGRSDRVPAAAAKHAVPQPY